MKPHPKFFHKVRKQFGEYTPACKFMQAANPDTTSIFLYFEQENDVLEVSKSLLTGFEESAIH